MNTENFCDSTLNKVLAERGAHYGGFSEMAALAQDLKSRLRRIDMGPVQLESIDLICTKLARLACGDPNHIDSWLDIGGYANLVVKHLQEPASQPSIGGWRGLETSKFLQKET